MAQYIMNTAGVYDFITTYSFKNIKPVFLIQSLFRCSVITEYLVMLK